MILIEVLTAVKNKYQQCKFQNWLYFGVVTSSLSIWKMGVSRSWSAGIELGIWGCVTKPCEKDSSLSCTHTSPSCFSQPPKLQLEGLLTKWFCLWQTLIYWLCQGLDTKNLFTELCSPFGGKTVMGRRLSSGWRAFSAFGIVSTRQQLQPFVTSSDVFIKGISWVSESPDWY